MSGEQCERRALRALAGQWIFGLDRWLCRRFGIYEYSAQRECLFRAEITRAERSVVLCDGVRVQIGDPLLQLHLWNEHVPAMGRRGPTVAWARHTAHLMDASLRELARYLEHSGVSRSVVALRARMRLRTDHQIAQLARIFGRFGFESVVRVEQVSLLRLAGENVLMLLLILATNPVSLRAGLLRRDCMRVIISTEKFMQLYAGRAPRPAPAAEQRAAGARTGQDGVRRLRPPRDGAVKGRGAATAGGLRRPG